MSNSLSARLLCPWDSPGKNSGVNCHALLQRIFPTQGSNLPLLCLLHWLVGSFFTTSATWEGKGCDRFIFTDTEINNNGWLVVLKTFPCLSTPGISLHIQEHSPCSSFLDCGCHNGKDEREGYLITKGVEQ